MNKKSSIVKTAVILKYIAGTLALRGFRVVIKRHRRITFSINGKLVEVKVRKSKVTLNDNRFTRTVSLKNSIGNAIKILLKNYTRAA